MRILSVALLFVIAGAVYAQKSPPTNIPYVYTSYNYSALITIVRDTPNIVNTKSEDLFTHSFTVADKDTYIQTKTSDNTQSYVELAHPDVTYLAVLTSGQRQSESNAWNGAGRKFDIVIKANTVGGSVTLQYKDECYPVDGGTDSVVADPDKSSVIEYVVRIAPAP